MNIGGSVYLQSGDLPPDWQDVSGGYFCGVAVVPDGTYPNDQAAIYVDGMKMPFVPMRGCIAGYRQRSRLQRSNEWQMRVCRGIGFRWGRAAAKRRRDRVMFLKSSHKVRNGFLGLSETCHRQHLLDELIHGVYDGSEGQFTSVSVFDGIGDGGQWLGSCCVIQPCQTLRRMAYAVAETMGGIVKCA